MKRNKSVPAPPCLGTTAAVTPPAAESASLVDFPQDLPGIDLPAALARLSGNRGVLLRFLLLFHRSWGGVMDQLRLALAQNAFKQAHLRTHSLHGAAAMLAMPEVVAAAGELEKALHQDNRQRIPDALEELDQALIPVLAGLATLSPEPPSLRVSPAQSLPSMRILVVDDVPENLELIGYYLKDSPFELVQAASGEDALLRFEAEQFDCVLLDMQLPGIGGPETLRAFRSMEATQIKPLTPVIGVSVGNSNVDFQKALAAGCVAYLPRPVEKADLLSAILGHCLSRAIEEQPAAPEDHADATARGELLPRVLARLTACAEELADAGRQGCFTEVGRLGHTISGLGMTFGLAEAERLGSVIELTAKNKDAEMIEKLAAQVRDLSR